jgi:hypothetical protein
MRAWWWSTTSAAIGLLAYGIAATRGARQAQGPARSPCSRATCRKTNLLARSTVPRAVCHSCGSTCAAAARAMRCSFCAAYGVPRSRPGGPRTAPPRACRRGAAPCRARDGRRAHGDGHRRPAGGWHEGAPVVAMVFYRSHLQAGNTAVFDALIAALSAEGLNPLPVALDSLKDPLCRPSLQRTVRAHEVQLVLNTTAFAALGQGAIDEQGEALALAGDAPVLQVIVSGGNREDWLADSQGLRPRDIAMQIALPEMDGRIITRADQLQGPGLPLPHADRRGATISPSPTAWPSSPSWPPLVPPAQPRRRRQARRADPGQLPGQRRPHRQRRGPGHAGLGHRHPARCAARAMCWARPMQCPPTATR